MAPKRKRTDAEVEQPSKRLTRSGIASSASGAKPSTSLNKSGPDALTKTKAKVTARGGSEKKQTVEKPLEVLGASEDNLEISLKKGKTPRGKSKPDLLKERTLRKAVTSSSCSTTTLPSVINHAPYAKDRMEKLFVAYADADDPSFIGGDGLEKLCADGGISMEGAQPLILAWILEASELGKLTNEEWSKGLDTLQIDTLEKLNVALTELENLLIFDKPALKPPALNKKTAAAVEPYDRNFKYWHYATNVRGAFLEFYGYVFSLAKAPEERNINVEIAKIFWLTLLAWKYPIIKDLVDFINIKATLKGVNKDLWAMTLDFMQSVDPSLENYEAEGAWPTLLDEFVAWKKDSYLRGATNATIE